MPNPPALNTVHHVPQSEAAANKQYLKPEWLRIPEAVRLFGLGRSTIYNLLADGAIKSTSLKRRGNIQGIRLISYDSLAAYIEASVVTGGQK